MDFFASMACLFFAVGLLSLVWRWAKSMIGDPYESMPSHSLETSEEALRSARRKRIAAEHALWEQEFHAGIHSRRDCTCLLGDSPRPVARWQRHRQ